MEKSRPRVIACLGAEKKVGASVTGFLEFKEMNALQEFQVLVTTTSKQLMSAAAPSIRL